MRAFGGVIAAAVTAIVAATAVLGAVPASADAVSEVPTAAAPAAARMGDYAVSGFAAQAAQLPAGLDGAIQSQLGISAQQYLADGQAAADAAQLIAVLDQQGIEVLSSRIDGTKLTVGVGSTAEFAAVRAAGATPVVAASALPPAPAAVPADAASASQKTVHGGDGWFYYTDTTSYQGIVCSVGFTGYDATTGASQFLTSGHCDAPSVTGDAAPATPFYAATSSTPNTYATDGSSIGTPVAGTFTFGAGTSADAGLVATDTGHAPEADVTSWGAGASSGAGQYVPVLGESAGVVGAPVCRSGWRSGWQCGSITGVDVGMLVGGQLENTISTDACALPGDSGGSVMMGGYAVGVLSGGTWPDCSPATIAAGAGAYRSVAFPLISTAGKASVSSLFPNWRIAIAGQPLPAAAQAAAASSAAKSGARVATKASSSASKPKKLKSSTPKIAGVLEVGAVLTARPGSWTAGVVKHYQWYLGSAKITGATAYRYRVPAKYAGKRISVVVSGTRSGYAKSVTRSKATAKLRKR